MISEWLWSAWIKSGSKRPHSIRFARFCATDSLEIPCLVGNHHRMPLIKLNRINKGGEIIIGTEHVVYIEVESKTTTVHMTNGLLFSVEEPMDAILQKIDALATRMKGGTPSS